MANTTPTARSFNTIVGDISAGILSRIGQTALRAGGPLLSLIEAVSQSQLRSSQDIFDLLASNSLDTSEGTALDLLGLDENRPRIGATASFGFVTIIDSTFTKINSKVFRGASAPIAGSNTIKIEDGTNFTPTGSIYIGRSTANFEGPLAYSSITNVGAYWEITLTSPTLKFHNIGEDVILAQGGDRTVSAGTIVQTPAASTSSSVSFRTLFSVTIPDGETQINNVSISCLTPGVNGNVPANSVTKFSNPPFTGASVTNPSPISNGLSIEGDQAYRESIKLVKQTKGLGTSLAVQNGVINIVSSDENKRVLSSSIVDDGALTTLYIDDGTGYEEIESGVATEILIDSATGGETYFSTSKKPITKASLTTTLVAPYLLSDGLQLSFFIGGIESVHTFSTDQFKSITSASAFEVASSINSNSTLLWNARPSDSGTTVTVFAKSETNEFIENNPLDLNDANLYMGFPLSVVSSINLYKNDRLLNKDGSLALIQSNPFSNWGSLSGPQTLTIQVDNITLNFDGVMFPTFKDQDFVDAGTSFVSLGKNTPDAWAKVINFKIPGITATVDAGLVTIKSNKGASSSAQLSIISGTLVTNNLLPVVSSIGSNNDYTVNKNTGQIKLTSPLSAGDKLSIGSDSTRAFIQSSKISPTTIAINSGNLWFNIDGDAELIQVGNVSSLTITNTVTSWGFRVRVTSATPIFQNLTPGDFFIGWDPGFPSSIRGAIFRVATVDPSFNWFEIETKVAIAGAITLTNKGMAFVRASTTIRESSVPIGTNYTASSFVTQLNSGLNLAGATASVYRTNYIRLNTNTFNKPVGSIDLLTADVNGKLLLLTPSDAITNSTGHIASTESGSSEIGTPDFHQALVASSTDRSHLTVTYSGDPLGIYANPLIESSFNSLRSFDEGSLNTNIRYSSNKQFYSFVEAISGSTALTLKTPSFSDWVNTDRNYFANPFRFSYDDLFGVLIDNDIVSKRFIMPMSRKLQTVGTTYASSNKFKDADNSGQSLVTGFGNSFDFIDYAIFMASRGKTDDTDATKRVLWRWFRLGPDGDFSRTRYVLPTKENQSATLSVNDDPINGKYTNADIVLPSGSLKTPMTLRNTSYIGVAAASSGPGLINAYYLFGFPIASATKATNLVTLTLTPPSGDITGHGINLGDTIFVNSTDINFSSGAFTVTSNTPTSLTLTYNDPVAGTVGPSSNIGTISRDNVSQTSFPPSTAIGDFFIWGSSTAISPIQVEFTNKATRVLAKGPQYVKGIIASTTPVSTVVFWDIVPIENASKVKVYASSPQTVSTIVGIINSLNSVIKGTIIGSGAGVIDRSSDESALTVNTFFNLSDGINFVQLSSVVLGDYQFTFKLPITSSLATNSDWANEDVRLIPITGKNTTDWLNSLTVTGLSSVADIQRSTNATKIQISSKKAGSNGMVQIQGSTSNNKTAAVVGQSRDITNSPYDLMVSSINSFDITGLSGRQWIQSNNTNKLPRTLINANTKLNSITVNTDNTATFTINSDFNTKVWTEITHNANVVLQVEKQGNFVALSNTGLGSAFTSASLEVTEGQWIRLSDPTVPIAGNRSISQSNKGIYRIVRAYSTGSGPFTVKTVWIENPSAVDQNFAKCNILVMDPESIQPGDTLSISTDQWGIANKGLWTITGANYDSAFTSPNYYSFNVSTEDRTPDIAIPTPASLGNQASLVQIIEGSPVRLYKQILTSYINSESSSLYDIKFTTNYLFNKIGESAGSVFTVLDKLNFPLATVIGIDGYKFSEGLVAEANKVIYGDPSDTATYPGVLAINSNVNIHGPLIKRINLSLQLRLSTGINKNDIADRVKSVVASFINKAPIGKPISLSDIISEAAGVSGVVTVSMIYPQFSSTNDLITVQPTEKPLIIDIDSDILINFV